MAVVGDHKPVAVTERPEYARMVADPDPEAAARAFGVLSAELVEGPFAIGIMLCILALISVSCAAALPETRSVDMTAVARASA